MAKDTEAVNLDSQTEGELPKPQISEQPAGQPLDQAGDSSANLESLRAMVREELQSVKDTRIGKSETRLDNLEAAIAQYEAEKGGTVDKSALSKLQGVQREKELLARLEILEGGNVAASSPGGGEQTWENQEATILERDGISKEDPRLFELLKSNTYASHDEYVKDLNEKAFTWRQEDAKKPVPSDSTIAQIIPSVPTGDGKYSEVTYKEAVVAARGKPEEITKIRDQALADGVDVYNISFEL